MYSVYHTVFPRERPKLSFSKYRRWQIKQPCFGIYPVWMNRCGKLSELSLCYSQAAGWKTLLGLYMIQIILILHLLYLFFFQCYIKNMFCFYNIYLALNNVLLHTPDIWIIIDQKLMKLVKCLKHCNHLSSCVLCISKYMCTLLRTLSSLHPMSPILIIYA